MTVRELQSWLRYIYKDPAARNYEIVVETREEWKHYHLSPGFASRYENDKAPVVVWRME